MLRKLMLLGALLLAACAGTAHRERSHVLIFSHTSGFRHASIEQGSAALTTMLRGRGYEVVASEDVGLFSDAGLAPFDAILFLSDTTKRTEPATEWLSGAPGEALQRWYRRQGAVVGVHAASDSHYGWAWYGAMMGSRFQRHPTGTPTGTIAAKSGWGLPATLALPEEWYRLEQVDPKAELLVTLDPATIGQPAGPAWPVSYRHVFEGHRVFYTSLGHRPETFADPRFLDHVARGLDWALAGRR